MKRFYVAAVAMIGVAAWAAGGQERVKSPTNKHNLSTRGPGPVRSTTVDQICIFCHTPHTSNPLPPLWSQTESSGVTYTPYSSSTMAATAGVPTGSSKLCLSCHDGTVAIGNSSRGQIPMAGVDAKGRLAGAGVLGVNLSDDHPISFVPVTGPQIVNPPPGDQVKLDASGMMQCRSCHDPHLHDADTTVKKFLVKSNSSSALCLTCHQKQYWQTNPSSHQISTSVYTAAQGAHTGYTTVATNGCESCHKAHTAAASARVLKAQEEGTCGTGTGAQCHGPSRVAAKNIAAEFNKRFSHPTYDVTPSVHDAAESPSNPSYRLPETSGATARHAECSDCHNPHAAYSAAASPPKASGANAGVWGIDSNGNRVDPSGTPPSVNEYEICYKCHADSANNPGPVNGPSPPYPDRVQRQGNKRLQFDPANSSYHPIEAPGKSPDVPSLKAPWTTGSIIRCTDCHGNDTGPRAYPAPGTGPDGVHGSNNKHLLVARYDTDVHQNAESAAAYALCYKCHDRNSILGDVTYGGHSKHLNSRTSCHECHDPHGISANPSNLTGERLINFDRRTVSPNSVGQLYYQRGSGGTGSGVTGSGGMGSCYLTCHGVEHRGAGLPGGPGLLGSPTR